MINRVSDNDYYDYRKLKMPTTADTTNNGEKFSLGYQRADDKKEDDEKQDKIADGLDKSLSGNKPHTVIQSGVKLELSGTGQEKDSGTKESGLFDLISTVRTWFTAFIQSCKELLDRIWNDPALEDGLVSTEEVPVEETERLSEEYLEINSLKPSSAVSGKAPDEPQTERIDQLLSGRVDRDKEIQKYLRSGNLEQVISLLTENGHRTMARNSSLLTYYDRTGRLTSLSASDQERILHGDRNVRKL